MSRIVIALLTAALLLLAGCTGQRGDANKATGADNVVTEPVSNTNSRDFSITARQWQFDPDTIRVKQGDIVSLEITSIDVEHGFSIDEYDVSVKLQPGRTASVSFRADKTGTFRFYCSVFCGAGHQAMEGKLVVE